MNMLKLSALWLAIASITMGTSKAMTIREAAPLYPARQVELPPQVIAAVMQMLDAMNNLTLEANLNPNGNAARVIRLIQRGDITIITHEVSGTPEGIALAIQEFNRVGYVLVPADGDTPMTDSTTSAH